MPSRPLRRPSRPLRPPTQRPWDRERLCLVSPCLSGRPRRHRRICQFQWPKRLLERASLLVGPVHWKRLQNLVLLLRPRRARRCRRVRFRTPQACERTSGTSSTASSCVPATWQRWHAITIRCGRRLRTIGGRTSGVVCASLQCTPGGPQHSHRSWRRISKSASLRRQSLA